MVSIAVVGHNRTMDIVVELIKNHFKNIKILKIEFVDMEMKHAAVEYLKAHLNQLDGVVFTGKIPYEIVNGMMHVKLPQIYIRHDSSILLQTLVEAMMTKSYDIKKVSCDTYSIEDLFNVYSGFGLKVDQVDIKTPPENIVEKNMICELYSFHMNNYYSGDVSVCITGISKVYEQLQDEGIPSLLLRPTTEAITNSIKELLNKINAVSSTESQIVVISMEIDLPNEYNLIHENEYQLMLEKTRVTEEVYRFAETIQAAVVEVGIHNYLLFSTRKIFEAATSHVLSLSILRAVSENSVHTMSIGVGYGKTARAAKYNASIGLNSALSKGGNQAFLVDGGKFSSPIYPNEDTLTKVNTISELSFRDISEETGISINNIYRLHCIKEKKKKACFTSGELAQEFGNTRRSMNRIIEKLERCGYVKIEGTRMISDTGRPTRIIRLIF